MDIEDASAVCTLCLTTIGTLVFSCTGHFRFVVRWSIYNWHVFVLSSTLHFRLSCNGLFRGAKQWSLWVCLPMIYFRFVM